MGWLCLHCFGKNGWHLVRLQVCVIYEVLESLQFAFLTHKGLGGFLWSPGFLCLFSLHPCNQLPQQVHASFLLLKICLEIYTLAWMTVLCWITPSFSHDCHLTAGSEIKGWHPLSVGSLQPAGMFWWQAPCYKIFHLNLFFHRTALEICSLAFEALEGYALLLTTNIFLLNFGNSPAQAHPLMTLFANLNTRVYLEPSPCSVSNKKGFICQCVCVVLLFLLHHCGAWGFEKLCDALKLHC